MACRHVRKKKLSPQMVIVLVVELAAKFDKDISYSQKQLIMKSRMIVVFVLAVVVTLSFSFTISKTNKSKAPSERSTAEPIGGFVSESRF